MSAQEEILLVERITNVLYQRGHMMTRFTINYLLQQLNEHIERMINFNAVIERNRVDEQTLLLQQLNEINERMSQDIINPQQENIQNEYIDLENDGLSEQTDHIYNEETFAANPAIIRRLFVTEDMIEDNSIRNNPIERSKVIARKKLEEFCPYDCSICQETPKHKDAVCTECNHYYCKGCWESWMNAEGSNKKCPTCRKDMPRITTFKARAPNRRRVV